MEASALHAPVLNRPSRLGLPGPLLRLRSDDQLVSLFRAGNDDAFRAIHDRYRSRLLAYACQMLPGSRSDAEDALQDVFVRAYASLRANDREIALRPWLYRVAHNRCIDEIRRPGSQSVELTEASGPSTVDPSTVVERRDDLQNLVTDVSRLPEQQRSALLMREINGLAYNDIAEALDVTVPAVKSLLVRARVGLADAAEARDTGCDDIRLQLADARERGVRASGQARRHMRDCGRCRAYKGTLRATDRQLAALAPPVGFAAVFAKLLGFGGGGAAAGGGAAGSAIAGGAVTGAVAAAGHVVAVVAVAAVAAGGAVEVSNQIDPPKHKAHHAAVVPPVAHAVPAAIPAITVPRTIPLRSLVAPKPKPKAKPEAKIVKAPTAVAPVSVSPAVTNTPATTAPSDTTKLPADPTATTPDPTNPPAGTTTDPTTTTVDPEATQPTGIDPVATGATVTTPTPPPVTTGPVTTTGNETTRGTQASSGG